ncbi:MAG: diguanylate cyclase [Pseudomonadales bacterium]
MELALIAIAAQLRRIDWQCEETVKMASITKLRTAESVQFFDSTVALSLVQAFHRHLDLERLLQIFWGQASALVQATGLRYRNPELGLEFDLGTTGRHTASYNLTYQEQRLGELLFRFQRRVDEDTLATAEDLIALVMPAIKNALAYYAACRQAQPRDPAARPGGADLPVAAAAEPPPNDDTLLLVGLDGFNDIRRQDGEAWAQTLISTVQEQLRDGLRDADSVFQIDEGVLAVLLPRTSEAAALDVAAKVRILIGGLHLKNGSLSNQLTACMGIASAGRGNDAAAVLRHARRALDEARREGSNCVHVYR